MLTKTTAIVVVVLAVILVFSEAYWSRQYRRGRWYGGRRGGYNYGNSGEDSQSNDSDENCYNGRQNTNVSGLIVCENGQLSLYCPAPAKILISQAIYGRTTNESVCLLGTTPISINCTSAFSNSIVKGLCNGLHLCNVLANNLLGGTGGDPCPGTDKYLNITYCCVQPKAYY